MNRSTNPPSKQAKPATRSAFNPRRRKPANVKQSGHGLAPSAPGDGAQSQGFAAGAIALESRKGNTELRPGMFISDEDDKQGVVVHAFRDLDLVIYRHADGQLDYSNISAVDAIPHPVAAHDRAAYAEYQEEKFGRKFDTEIRPGMAIRDCPGERSGVVWHAFNALDLVVYMCPEGKLHHTRVQDVYIEPRPNGASSNFYFPAHLHPPCSRRDALAPLKQIDDLLITAGELLAALRAIRLAQNVRPFIAEYPASCRDHVRAMISDLYEFRANFADELIGNVDLPETTPDEPLRSADEIRAEMATASAA